MAIVYIYNCHSYYPTATVGVGAGGIVGQHSKATVTNCSSNGAISANGGGIAGRYFSGTVINCHSTGQIGGSNAGGITGSYCTGSAINCYSTGNAITNSTGGKIILYLPSLSTTSAITAINANTAISGGTILFNGGTVIIASGVCWSLAATPTIVDNKTSDGTSYGTGVSFTAL